MYYPAKPPRYNKVNNKNFQTSTSNIKCEDILPSPILLNSDQQQINKKYIINKSDVYPGCSKRAFNLRSNNNHNKNDYNNLKNSNSFQNFCGNNEHNSSSAYLNNKFDLTLNAKKIVTSKNFLQNHKPVNKLILEPKNSTYKKCEKISKTQHGCEQNPEELLNKIPNRLEEPVCHDAIQKTDESSILCNIPSNENIKHHKENEKEDKLDDRKEDYVSGCTKETREKTPMCLVNDLARFNKIPFQYRLTSEHGPAHCKKFTVTLILGDEEYTAEGFKIKKAQHLAAKEAIEKTKYKHPIPKANRRSNNEITTINITPTVELNALAMKLGQQTCYILDPKQGLSSENNTKSETYNISEQTAKPNVNQSRRKFDKCENNYSTLQQFFRTNKFNQLSPVEPSYISNSSPCKITLIVGNQKFFGIGKTPQQAKHDAATNALQVLKNQMIRKETDTQIEILDESEHKSPISLVFEIGIKRNLPVDFKVLREQGPAHMRTFTTACIVGNIITEGEGTGKKLSKKKAAQKMLEELKMLPPLSSNASSLKRTKTKTSSKKVEDFSIKSVTDCKKIKKKIVTETDPSNPVTKLLAWHQNNNEKEPEFKLISESGKENFRKRQFVMEISSNKIIARGIGNSKKLAKRDAAQNFLDAVNKKNEVHSNKNENVSNIQSECLSDEKYTTMDQEKLNITSDGKAVVDINEQNVEHRYGNSSEKSLNKVVDNQSSKSLNLNNTVSKSSGLHMKDQLLYLANLLGFEVDFSDYPKGNHNEFLTIVMLSTNPPQISHGVGINSRESQEDASKNALKILSEMGLNNAAKP